MNPLDSWKISDKRLPNCDLPPLVKVFLLPETTVISSPPVRIDSYIDDDRLELLKALRFSQTRAREAEREAASLRKERDLVYEVLAGDSIRLFGYRQLVRLLEIEMSVMRMPQKKREKEFGGEDFVKETNDGGGGSPWFVSLAVLLGIAGVGFVFGCRYFDFVVPR